jgi:hypothetical protein
MKHRNEELGHYANPVQRVRHGDIKYMFSSLPGYDIIDITVPFVEGEEEVGGAADLYSGLWEPRFQASNKQHYLRWYPSDYELFNTGLLTPVSAGLGASVDGAEDRLSTAPMPPNRWMRNDYTYDPEDPLTKEEAPWFKDTGKIVSATSIHPGKYSGKLRELVQMQLGYGLLPQFSYSASNANGIHLETLDEDTTRVWLYQISGTNGVVMQIMADYSVANFEKAELLKTGGIPPEIEEAGWFDRQTSFDSAKPVYTKAEWDALPDDERPDIKTVTFRLLSSAAYLAAVGSYGVYGDYGWSFNPAGTSAVLVGIEWNTPGGGGLASSYRSNLFTIALDPTAFTASISGAGARPFLMDSSFDHVKFPKTNGALETVYFWKGENGFKGTQPSSSYTAPIYAYYNLNGELVQCDYTYAEGTTETQNGGSAFPTGWAEIIACRQRTTLSATNYHYKGCSSGRSGTGTFGQKHGFSTTITSADTYSVWGGYSATFSATTNWGNKGHDTWWGTAWNKRATLPNGAVAATRANMDSQYLARTEGSFGGSTKSVLIVPSFERLAFYHYKSLNTTLTGGRLTHPNTWLYERGQPVRQAGLGGTLGDPCEFAGCGWPVGVLGFKGNLWPDADTEPEYYVSNTQNVERLYKLYTGCTGDGDDCFGENELVPSGTPGTQDPYSEDITTVVGGLMLPNGASIMFSDDEINNQSEPFRESSASFGYQSVVSCFDTFSSKYIFSMPNIAMTDLQHTATGFPDDITQTGVLFSGMPYFTG